MAVETFQILDEEGHLVGPAQDLTVETLRNLYRHMVLLRALDARMMALQRQGRIGFYGTVTGEEAAVVGSASVLRPDDWVYPALRQGGVALQRGYPLLRYVAQCLGNAEDLLKGHMQPCHFASRSVNHVSWSSCIGNQLPQAVGTAMAIQYRGDSAIVLAYLGDGATSTSDFHVALNFAGVFRPPVVFLCQNNQWAISVPVSRQTVSASLAIKGEAYGMRGVRVDGNDVLAVRAATEEALERARSGEGPTFVEALTYRMGGHSTSDDAARYRNPEEVERWEARDPLLRFRAYLLDRGVLSDATERTVRAAVEKEVYDAVQMAERGDPLRWETLLEDVYRVPPWNLEEQRAVLARVRGL